MFLKKRFSGFLFHETFRNIAFFFWLGMKTHFGTLEFPAGQKFYFPTSPTWSLLDIRAVCLRDSRHHATGIVVSVTLWGLEQVVEFPMPCDVRYTALHLACNIKTNRKKWQQPHEISTHCLKYQTCPCLALTLQRMLLVPESLATENI